MGLGVDAVAGLAAAIAAIAIAAAAAAASGPAPPPPPGMSPTREARRSCSARLAVRVRSCTAAGVNQV